MGTNSESPRNSCDRCSRKQRSCGERLVTRQNFLTFSSALHRACGGLECAWVFCSTLTSPGRPKHARILRCSGTNLTMEDRLIWADTVSSYVLHDSGIDRRILEMWGHLRKATVYFMRYQPGQHREDYIEEAQRELFQYAALVQEYFGGNELLTYQLHACMAHVAAQARHSGPTAFAGEWWLERCMQVFKRITKYRSTRHPECVGTNHFLAVQALDRTAYCHPRATRITDAISPSGEGKRRDDSDGSEWLVGACEEVSDCHAEVRMLVQWRPIKRS